MDDGAAQLMSEIRSLRSALDQVKFGVVGIGVCVAEALAEPGVRQRLGSICWERGHILDSLEHGATREMLLAFARALNDLDHPASDEPQGNDRKR